MDEESKKKAIIAVVIVVVILIVGVSIYFYLNSKKKTANTATSNLLTRSNLQSSNLQTSSKLQSINLQSSNLQTSSKLQSINLQSSNLQTLALAGPCSTYTDASPASSVSVACLRDTLKGYGCVESATLYGDLTDNYNGWWKQDTNGAGTFGGIKADMRSYGDATSGDKYTSCKGSSGNSPVVPPTVTPPEVPPTVTPPEVPPTVTPPVVVPAGVAPPVSASGEYHIVTGPGHRVPNKMLLLHGSATNGETTIGTWDYIPDEMICKWKLIPAGDDEYHLVTGPGHRVPNKMLLLHGSATNGEATIGTWDYLPGDTVCRWKLMSAGADEYHLVTSRGHRVPNKMLLLHGSATNGEATIGTWDYLPGDTICKWKLMPAAPEPAGVAPPVSASGEYHIVTGPGHRVPNKMLLLHGSATNGETTIGTWDYIPDEMICKWKLIPAGDDEYHLVTGPGHRVPNKMLLLHGSATNGEATIGTWDYLPGDTVCRWKLMSAGADEYHLVTSRGHRVPNKMLLLHGSATNGEATIGTWDYLPGDTICKWKLMPAAPEPAGVAPPVSASGEYHIVTDPEHRVPNKMLLLHGSATNGETTIGTWDYIPDEMICKWKLMPAANNEYHLVTGPRHRVPNKMLFLHGSATNGETTIGTWDYAANDLSTTWKLMSAGADKKYHLVTSPKHRVPNKMLLLHGSATNGETTIGTWDYLPGDTICKWTLMPAAPEPCSRYTDSSRASSVSVACLRDTLKSVGCFEGASLYSELTDNYTGWWKQDTGAGTFGGIKADMRTYGIATFGEKGIACKGNVDSTNEYHLVTGPGHRGVPNKMLYLHGMDTNPVVSSWDYWVDPQTRWKIIYIGNGDYHIVTGSNHKVSNKMLHLDGSDTNGQTTIKGSNYVASNQRIKWKLIPAGADEYHIVSSQDHQVPNKMLLLNGNTTNGETHIGTWDYSPDDTFCKWKVILAPRPETYRYVRIYRDRSGAEHFLNITEVKVLSGNRNVARGKTVTASSIYDQTVQAGNLVDGNRNTLAHTNDGIVEWFLIDLGQEYEIINVEIINRVDCCKNRLKNTKVQLSKAANMSSRKESRVITPTEALNAVITWHVATNDFTFSQSLPSTLNLNII